MKPLRVDSGEGATRYPIARPEVILVSHRSPCGRSYVRVDNKCYAIACLRCPDRPCFSFSRETLRTPPLGYLVSPDLKTDVCPFGAMVWNPERSTPEINANTCACCGLCVARCPVGAIGLDRGYAQLCEASELHDLQVMDDAAFFAHRDTVAEVVQRGEVAGRLSDESLVAGAIELATGTTCGQVAFRLFVRNALLSMGMPAQLSKVGDTHSRPELTFSDGAFLGLAELEPGEDLLDTSRRLFADVAHAMSTRGVEAGSLRPTIVCGRLPNARTDVYHLLLDIDDVFGLSVAAVPLVAIVAAVIARLRVDDFVVLLDAYEAPKSAVPILAELTGFPVESLVRGGAAPKK